MIRSQNRRYLQTTICHATSIVTPKRLRNRTGRRPILSARIPYGICTRRAGLGSVSGTTGEGKDQRTDKQLCRVDPALDDGQRLLHLGALAARVIGVGDVVSHMVRVA